ncbi:MAG TPA: transcriptional regulator [Planctomycetaceae bacterium]|nr:transcriptional regulator [Planctomycetaceae bacterium]
MRDARPPCVTCEPFDIVVVPFPFTDRDTTKRRPALVVSTREFNTRHAQLVLAMITTTGGGWPSDVPIEEWRKAGLATACRVRLKLFTLDTALIVKRVGTLSPRDAGAVGAALERFLAAG